MIVDMRCPKCGGNTTQFDERKWRCLACGNYFLYEPIEAPTTTVQQFVNVSGASRFNLDVSHAVDARALYDTIKDHWSEAVTEYKNAIYLIEQRQRDVVLYTAKLGNWKIPTFSLIGITLVLAAGGSGWAVISGIAAFFFLIELWELHGRLSYETSELNKHMEEKLALENPDKKTIVGYQPICPYCRKEVPAAEKVLSHCTKCGKQFVYIRPMSYPIHGE